MGPEITFRECTRYTVYSQGNGLFARIERKADGASVFLQGDEAEELLDIIDRADRPDDVCSGYDDVMQA